MTKIRPWKRVERSMASPAPSDVNWVHMGGSCIKEAAYDVFTRRLWIRFVHGRAGEYGFKDFPEAKWKLFRAAGSKGTFYHQHIKGRYLDI